jgi:hypothetical protein
MEARLSPGVFLASSWRASCAWWFPPSWLAEAQLAPAAIAVTGLFVSFVSFVVNLALAWQDSCGASASRSIAASRRFNDDLAASPEPGCRYQAAIRL